MAFYSYLSTKIIIAFITKSYQDLFGVRSYINAIVNVPPRYYWPIPFETLSKSKGKITNGYGLAQE